MKITIENYERYALDFLEGHLGYVDEVEFQQFLDHHPEIKEELMGIDQIMLVPDIKLQYANKEALYRKEKAGIISMWNSSWVVAAAVALLLVPTAILFLRNDPALPVENLADNQPFSEQSGTENKVLPATKSPMPEEQPETSVMAHQGIVPGQEENFNRDTPALAFGTTQEDEQRSNAQDQKPQQNRNEEINRESIAKLSLQNPEIPEVKDDLQTADDNVPLAKASAVAFLPVKSSEVISDPTVNLSSLALSPIDEANTIFEIHIPSQFLSETWTDVSFSNFKQKLLPEFLKPRQNLPQ